MPAIKPYDTIGMPAIKLHTIGMPAIKTSFFIEEVTSGADPEGGGARGPCPPPLQNPGSAYEHSYMIDTTIFNNNTAGGGGVLSG